MSDDEFGNQFRLYGDRNYNTPPYFFVEVDTMSFGNNEEAEDS